MDFIGSKISDIFGALGQYAEDHLHDVALMFSSDLDSFVGIALVILLFLRLFQWKAAGKAILPMFGVYLILKVVLP